MKRLLLLAALGAAAALLPAPASANHHLCVTWHGQDVVCAPDLGPYLEYLEMAPKPVCVTYGPTTIVCV